MLRAVMAVLTLIVLAVVLAGCGGGPVSPPLAPPDDGAGGTSEVGPMLVRTASAAGLVIEDIPLQYGYISLAAIHGAQINYLASQAMLDRIVFVRGTETDADIFVCNLDGSNEVRLTDNTAAQLRPCWSPDGTRIAFDRKWPAQDTEIMIMNADGSGITALTVNTATDEHPTFSPEGGRIAYQTDVTGNDEIFVMYADGSSHNDLSINPAEDRDPDWSHELGDSRIAFVSDRYGSAMELMMMAADGTAQTRLTTNTTEELEPAWHPESGDIAVRGRDLGGDDIMVVDSDGWYPPYDLSASAGDQMFPAWSSDGRFICYSSNAAGDYELVLQQTEEPWAKFAITANSVHDACVDLGSPTLQTDRVLIGPDGSDWGGTDPIWPNAYAGIVAWGSTGYLNFVRIGVRAEDLDTLEVRPLASTAQPSPAPAGVVIEAREIVNLRADGGRGKPQRVWDFDALNPTAVLVYLDSWTGQVLSAAVLRDGPYPAGAGAAAAGAVQVSAQGSDTVARGDFAAVFDAQGNCLGRDLTSLTIDARGEVTVG